ncbi:MAG: hypothetical protein ACLFU2_06235 [Opitutales bacterium]
MKTSRILLLVSAALALATVALWALGGFHLGWTQTRIAETAIDPITEIEFTTYRDGFVAGVEVFVLGLGLSALFGGLGFYFQRRESSTSGT